MLVAMCAVPRQTDLLQEYIESQGDNPFQKAQLDKDAAALKCLLPELQTVRSGILYLWDKWLTIMLSGVNPRCTEPSGSGGPKAVEGTRGEC